MWEPACLVHSTAIFILVLKLWYLCFCDHCLFNLVHYLTSEAWKNFTKPLVINVQDQLTGFSTKFTYKSVLAAHPTVTVSTCNCQFPQSQLGSCPSNPSSCCSFQPIRARAESPRPIRALLAAILPWSCGRTKKLVGQRERGRGWRGRERWPPRGCCWPPGRSSAPRPTSSPPTSTRSHTKRPRRGAAKAAVER